MNEDYLKYKREYEERVKAGGEDYLPGLIQEFNEGYVEVKKNMEAMQKKSYYERNKEKIIERSKLRYRQSKEQSQEKKKEYRLKNIDAIKKMKKESYQRNKEKHQQKNKADYQNRKIKSGKLFTACTVFRKDDMLNFAKHCIEKGVEMDAINELFLYQYKQSKKEGLEPDK